MRRVFVGLTTFLSMGCYTVEPLLTAPSPGQELVVQLTDAGSAQLAQYLGPGVSVINGRYSTTTADTLSLSVTSTETRTGDVHFWAGEPVEISKSVIATVNEKKLSALRSVLVAGAVIAGGLTLRLGFGGSSGNDRKVPPPSGQ